MCFVPGCLANVVTLECVKVNAVAGGSGIVGLGGCPGWLLPAMAVTWERGTGKCAVRFGTGALGRLA